MQAIVNWFVLVGQQWLSSLKIFLPNNFKLFIFVTLNAWLQGVKTFFKYFWWLIFVLWSGDPRFFGMTPGLFSFYKIIDVLPYFLMLLAIRPSVKRKTFSYFTGYILQFLLVTFAYFFVDFVIWLIFNWLNLNQYALFFNSLLSPTFLVSEWNVVFIFTMFFYLDSSGRVDDFFKSVWRAFKMTFYSYPFLLVTFVVFRVLLALFFFIQPFFLHILARYYLEFPFLYILFAFIFIFYAAWLNNFYLKRVHEDNGLYFD